MKNFNEVRLRTKEIEVSPSLEGCKKLILSVIKLLDSSIDTNNLDLYQLFYLTAMQKQTYLEYLTLIQTLFSFFS
jgi:hypothetical protein